MTVRVSFCCNDERGVFTGRCEALDFRDHRDFQADLAGGNVQISFLDAGTLRLSRKLFYFRAGSQRYGHGNWCWDAVVMTQGEALRLLRYALERGFSPEGWATDGPFARIIETHRQAAGGGA